MHPPNPVAIYLIPLSDSFDRHTGSLDVLSDAEQKRAASIGHETARLRFRLARYHLRTLLGERLGLAAADVPIAIAASGKPYLQENSGGVRMHFSLSHSANWIAIALCNRPVGLDLETRCPSTWSAISRRFFTVSEQRWIQASPSPEAAFVTLWTMKEAAVKMSGQTLLPGLRGFELLDGTHISDDSAKGLIAGITGQLPGGRWLSAAVLAGAAVNHDSFAVYELGENAACSIHEHLWNQFLMSRSDASG